MARKIMETLEYMFSDYNYAQLCAINLYVLGCLLVLFPKVYFKEELAWVSFFFGIFIGTSGLLVAKLIVDPPKTPKEEYRELLKQIEMPKGRWNQ